MTAADGTTISIARRVDHLDWTGAGADLDDVGIAAIGPVLTPVECSELRALYDEDGRFRSTIDMARHRFGEGQYRYFSHPLPTVVAEMRESFWPHLLPIARDWAARLKQPAPWPDDFDAWLSQCHAAGQARPTPLMLRYGPGDWNALHRDLYGDLVFPLQVVIGLDTPGHDYTGGEFVVVEQRPRMQSKAEVVTLRQGEAAIFATRERPKQGTKGIYRVQLRHGVSRIKRGERKTLGLIFHDAV